MGLLTVGITRILQSLLWLMCCSRKSHPVHAWRTIADLLLYAVPSLRSTSALQALHYVKPSTFASDIGSLLKGEGKTRFTGRKRSLLRFIFLRVCALAIGFDAFLIKL